MLDTATQKEQRERLQEWHGKVHVMHVAHMKAAVLCDRSGRGFGVFAAVLATFTGATWASDLSAAGAPGDLLKWIAAVAGLLSGVLIAVNTTMNWAKRGTEHQAASVRFAKLRYDMETWRVEHPTDDTPADSVIAKWMTQLADAEDKAPVVGWRALRNATSFVMEQPQQSVW